LYRGYGSAGEQPERCISADGWAEKISVHLWLFSAHPEAKKRKTQKQITQYYTKVFASICGWDCIEKDATG